MKQQKIPKKPLKTTARSKAKKKPLHTHVQRHAKLAVVPHAKNAYRPHLLRLPGLALIALAVIGLLGHDNFAQRGAVLGEGSDISSQQLLADTNADRAKNDLPPLTLDKQLSVAATLKANDMFAHDYWAHTSPSGVAPWHWFDEANYNYSYAGENLAKNFQSANGVMAAWMDSSEHRANILDKNYKNVGFAVVPGTLEGEKTMLVVAMYGAPKTAATVASVTAQDSTVGRPLSITERISIGLRSLPAEAIASVVLLLIVTLVALGAHQYRDKLPKGWRTSWRRHHNLYKAAGMATLVVAIVTLYSGGQI